MDIQFLDWGLIEYAEAWNKQTSLFDERVQAKLQASKVFKRCPMWLSL